MKPADPETTVCRSSDSNKLSGSSVPAEVQTELYSLFSQDPEASFQRMVDIAAEKGVILTVDEVKGFLKQMDENSEFDDLELDPIALTAIAGGGIGRGRDGCCQEGSA